MCKSTAYNQVLEYIKENPGQTATEIAESLGMKIRNTRIYLDRMCEDELIFIAGQKAVGNTARVANTYEYGTTPDCSEITIVWLSQYDPIGYIPDPLTSALFAHIRN